MAELEATPSITVLAGTNGGGKSSIGAALLRQAGGDSFDPDAAARRYREADPSLGPAEANARAWREGRRLLERAIGERKSFVLETTLGGRTLPALLERAASVGLAVRIWYVGLASPEQHVARVRARVARGGHDIPAPVVRRRYTASLQNLIRLLPVLDELRLVDNSEEGDPAAGHPPKPRLLLHTQRGRIVAPDIEELARTPAWARPIAAAVMKHA